MPTSHTLSWTFTSVVLDDLSHRWRLLFSDLQLHLRVH